MLGVKGATRPVKGHLMTGPWERGAAKGSEWLWGVWPSNWGAGGDIYRMKGGRQERGGRIWISHHHETLAGLE